VDGEEQAPARDAAPQRRSSRPARKPPPRPL